MNRADALSFLRPAIKMAAAATLAMGLVELLRLPSGFWAPLSALATMQAQIGASIASARNYIIANVIGILVGASLFTLVGDHFLVAGAGIFLVALAALALRLPPAGVAVACGVVPVIHLAVRENAFEYGWYRFLDVIIGLGSTILVSMVIFPSRAVSYLRRAIAGVVEDALGLAAGTARGLAAGTEPSPACAALSEQLVGRIHEVQGLVPAAHVECGPSSPLKALLEFEVEQAVRMRVRAATLYEDATDGISSPAGQALGRALDAVGETAEAAATAVAATIRSGGAGRPAPDARAAVGNLRAAVDVLHAADVTTLAQGADLLRLHAIVLAFDELTNEAERMVGRAEGGGTAEPTGISSAPPSGTPAAPLRWWRRTRL